VTIRMRRKSTSEARRPFRRREQQAVAALRPSCVRWARDNASHVANMAVPEIPVSNDRAADNWEVLTAIAQAAGPQWLARALRAAHALTDGTQDSADGDDLGERLLVDLRALIEDGHLVDQVSMKEVVDKLVRMDDAPWSEVNQGRPLTTGHLGKLMRRFGIKSKPVRFGRSQVDRGYACADFVDAFARYLPEKPVTPVTAPGSHEDPAARSELQRSVVTAAKSRESASHSGHVTRVTHKNGDRAQRGSSTTSHKRDRR
jgi:Protein of unknown function (DUF3631)